METVTIVLYNTIENNTKYIEQKIYLYIETTMEEQCGFRQGRGCMDQVFAVRQVCEKYLANGRDIFSAFIDLERPMILSIDMVCGRC